MLRPGVITVNIHRAACICRSGCSCSSRSVTSPRPHAPVKTHLQKTSQSKPSTRGGGRFSTLPGPTPWSETHFKRPFNSFNGSRTTEATTSRHLVPPPKTSADAPDLHPSLFADRRRNCGRILQAQLNRCNLPFFPAISCPFRAGGLCPEWKFTSPARRRAAKTPACTFFPNS